MTIWWQVEELFEGYWIRMGKSKKKDAIDELKRLKYLYPGKRFRIARCTHQVRNDLTRTVATPSP